MRKRIGDRLTILAFVGPAVFSLLAIGIAPLAFAVYTSVHRYQLTNLRRTPFVGLKNYADVILDEVFWQAMGRTMKLLIIGLPVQVTVGLGIALLLHRPGLSFLRTLTRLALVVPMATTYAVVGLLGQVMFNQKFGVINQMIGFLGVDPINWIGDTQNAFVLVIFWDVWQWTPFVALVLLAGLTTVPSEIEEAAKIADPLAHLQAHNWWCCAVGRNEARTRRSRLIGVHGLLS